ncbi:hypothetical protein [Tsuneonella rigui]|uniref:hypothetical protein n=1 Tax=Tsuneonella rigui TaxID=1708790 RepID=UPI001F494717|nr:hypothetical protein [Tsuneonella rigui]
MFLLAAPVAQPGNINPQLRVVRRGLEGAVEGFSGGRQFAFGQPQPTQHVETVPRNIGSKVPPRKPTPRLIEVALQQLRLAKERRELDRGGAAR